MANNPLTYDVLMQRIESWAMRRDDIRLGIIIGSRARTDKPADEMSDLDMLLFTKEPGLYLSEFSWLSELGEHRITFLEATAVGDFVERRVLFDGGLDVDFVPLPVESLKGSLGPEIGQVLKRGYRVFVDKDGCSSQLKAEVEAAKQTETNVELPGPAAFLHLVNDFLYHAVWSAKKLCRGELWTAKMCCDGYMKRQLLQMIEWHHQATSSGRRDTWHDGRFLDSWVASDVLSQLRSAFATYDTPAVWQALKATVHLFGVLGTKVATESGYSYPANSHTYAVQLIEEYEPQRQQ